MGCSRQGGSGGHRLEDAMKRILITGVLLCLTASLAMAGGVNFNWNTSKQCPTVQTDNWNFACDTNDVVMYMVASVTPNIAVVGFNAMDARIDGWGTGPVPAWWQAFNPGSCRGSAFTPGVIDVDPAAPCAGTASTRLWTTQAYGGMGAWSYDGSGRFHTVVGFATAGNRAENLSTTTRYNAFHIAVATTNTVAVAPDPDNGIAAVIACDGCSQGMCLELTQVGLYGSGHEDQLVPGMNYPITTTITYQGGPGWCIRDAARNTTWGQIKSLYR
jgi:hypothetical protein